MKKALTITTIATLIFSFSSSAAAQFFTPYAPPGFPQEAQKHPNRNIKKRGHFVFEVSNQAEAELKQVISSRFGFVTPGLYQNFLRRTLGVRRPQPIPGTEYWSAAGIRGNRLRRFRRARRQGVVQRDEQSYKIYSFSTDDTFMRFGLLWGLESSGGFFGWSQSDIDIDAPEAWEITIGNSDLVVGVIDTGVYLSHPDIADNLFENPLEVVNGLDDDGNGYIDDVQGWDFHNDDNSANDDNFHGTHVAGTIAALGNNRRGVVGVAPGVQILPLKVLGAGGQGDTSALIKAVEYAIGLKERGVNIAVLNASLGGGPEQEATRIALEKANAAGITFVAAAGNSTEDNDLNPVYPASYDVPNVISVASIGKTGSLSAFSNYGANSVDIAAPGEDIWSTIIFNFYLPSAGTSMAAPHVAGVAALVHSRFPDFTPARVRQRIRQTARPLSQLDSKLRTAGVVNAAAAVGR